MTICLNSDLIASTVHFDRFSHCLSFRTDILVQLYLSSYTKSDVCINAYFLKKYCCWSCLLICIFIDHDVNIAAKQCFSLELMRLATFQLRVLSINIQLEIVVDSAGSAWRSCLLRMEWNGMNNQGCLAGWRNNCGQKHSCYLCQTTKTPIFYYFSNPKQYFLFLIRCYLLHRISYFGCSKHQVQFSLILHVTIILVCFMLVVSPLCILPLFWLSC